MIIVIIINPRGLMKTRSQNTYRIVRCANKPVTGSPTESNQPGVKKCTLNWQTR